MDRAEALARFSAGRVAHLATITPAGRPHVVVITFALLGDAVVHAVDHKPKTTRRLQRLDNVAANPYASVLVDHYDEDWARLWWVRVDGSAEVVDDGARHTAAVAALMEKYPPYRETPPAGPVVSVSIDRVTWWEGSG